VGASHPLTPPNLGIHPVENRRALILQTKLLSHHSAGGEHSWQNINFALFSPRLADGKTYLYFWLATW
jgi:hypothetical protein